MDEIETMELAPGHELTSITPLVYTGGLQYGRRVQTAPTRYSCSCGEIDGVDTDAAQAHAEDVTP